MTSRAVVIGGGITGLTSAYDLARAGWRVDVFEADTVLGGKIRSLPVGDRMVDAGPDTFLARAPGGVELCRDLGLIDELTSPVAPVPAYLVRRGELHPMPAGAVLGVPTDLDALAASGVVSPDGAARAADDLTAPPTDLTADVSVGAVCRARL
ncbi:MAG: FAD-dependent oxidoreductase, partial [Acidimicrobiales bacterium]